MEGAVKKFAGLLTNADKKERNQCRELVYECMKSPAFAKSDPLKIAFRHGGPVSFRALVERMHKEHPAMVDLMARDGFQLRVRASTVGDAAVTLYSTLANPDGRLRRVAADAGSGAAAAAVAASVDGGNLDGARKRETLNKRAAGKSGGSDAKRRRG